VPVDPKHTAVVLIEYQNDFTSEGGALHGAVQSVMDKTEMLENTRKLVDAARAAGATIAWTRSPRPTWTSSCALAGSRRSRCVVS
jgi:nicotinamidase-related amidase